jgi:hypothetical protein
MKLIVPFIAASPLSPAVSTCEMIRARASNSPNASLKRLSISSRGSTTEKRLAGQAKRLALSGPTTCGRRASI